MITFSSKIGRITLTPDTAPLEYNIKQRIELTLKEKIQHFVKAIFSALLSLIRKSHWPEQFWKQYNFYHGKIDYNNDLMTGNLQYKDKVLDHLLKNQEFLRITRKAKKELMLKDLQENKYIYVLWMKLPKYEKEKAIFTTDKDLLLAAIQQGAHAFVCAHGDLKKDRDLILAAINGGLVDDFILERVYKDFKTDRELVLALAKSKLDGNFLSSMDESFRNDDEIMLAGLECNIGWLNHAPEKFKNNKELLIKAVKYNANALNDVPDHFKDDVDVVTAAVETQGYAIKFASDALKKDKKMALIAVRKNAEVYFELDHELKIDPAIILAAIKSNGEHFAANFLNNNPEWALEAVKSSPKTLHKIEPTIINYSAIALAAVELNGEVLQYASAAIKGNRDIVLTAVRNFGCALEFADPKLRDDPAIVLAAIKQNPTALEYASERLKGDKTFILEAAKEMEFIYILAFADKKFFKDRDFFSIAFGQDYSALQYVDPDLKKDPKLIMHLCQIYGRDHPVFKYQTRLPLEPIDSTIKNEILQNKYIRSIVADYLISPSTSVPIKFCLVQDENTILVDYEEIYKYLKVLNWLLFDYPDILKEKITQIANVYLSNKKPSTIAEGPDHYFDEVNVLNSVYDEFELDEYQYACLKEFDKHGLIEPTDVPMEKRIKLSLTKEMLPLLKIMT